VNFNTRVYVRVRVNEACDSYGGIIFRFMCELGFQ